MCSLRLSLRSLRLCVEGSISNFMGTGLRECFFQRRDAEIAEEAQRKPIGQSWLTITWSSTHGPPSAFWRAPAYRKILPGPAPISAFPAWALTARTGVYGPPLSHRPPKKAGVRAHIGSKITGD